MLNIVIKTQPDDETCGPTSLHAVYRYYHDNVSLATVIREVETVSTGGTIAAMLGKHALKRGYQASLYVYNLSLFDPTWFTPDGDQQHLAKQLRQQLIYKRSPKFIESTNAYLEFIDHGGKILYKDLTIHMLKKHFQQGQPILTGLSATYLYNSARERFTRNRMSVYDAIRGEPCGHFVVLCGYDVEKRRIIVADPHRQNPISQNNYYKVNISRLINAIMLGVLTYDANLLVIERT